MQRERIFKQLYKIYYVDLVSFAYSITHNSDAAEDIVQETFSYIYEKNIDIENISSQKAYIYNAVKNYAIDFLRHKNVVNNYANKAINIPMIHDGEAAIDELFAEDVYKILFDVIDQLPERVRQVFLLYAKGKKNHEIAEALNISVETVKTYKKRGKQMIKERMSDADFEKSLTLLMLLHLLSV